MSSYYYFFTNALNQVYVVERNSGVNTRLFRRYEPLTEEQVAFYLEHKEEYLNGTISVVEVRNCVVFEPPILDDLTSLEEYKKTAKQQCLQHRNELMEEMSDYTYNDRYNAILSASLRGNALLTSDCYMSKDEETKILKDANKCLKLTHSDYTTVIARIEASETTDAINYYLNEYLGLEN